jgi:Zn-dependent peptidase ImmA (M78 family)
MIEAQPLNQGYIFITEHAQIMNQKTNITQIFNIEDIIIPLGGKINFVNSENFNKINFITIYGPNNFEINLIDGVDKTFKRLLLIQALGHYVLHGESGERFCYVSSASKSPTSQEGLWFALALLIPDETFLKIHANFDNLNLSNLFRVPEFAIVAKRNIINKVYFNKE